MRLRRSVCTVADDRQVTWRTAMSDALYGDAGFYLAAGAPGRNFRTSAHTSPHWAAAIHSLAARIDASLDRPEAFTVVDVGAGGGELLAALAAVAPQRWSLCGVDLAPRPASLPARVTWQREPPPSLVGLLVAVELLDVVPLDVAVLTGDGPRFVTVSSAGDERIGAAVDDRDAEWLRSWWPLDDAGDRGEIGWPRDDLWRSLTSRLDRGVALAIDYAAVPSRDVAGTLTAYRDGRQRIAVPDRMSDLTAHVCFESLRTEGDVVLSQREALRALGISGERPTYDGDAAAYLAALASAGAAAELLDPVGLGAFTWLIHPKNCPTPLRTM
jgi:SAM-dependent MidA family methyltransferase